MPEMMRAPSNLAERRIVVVVGLFMISVYDSDLLHPIDLIVLKIGVG